MNKKRLLCIIFLLVVANYAFSQQRVAVIPFDAKNTSKIETEAITSVFETALVNLDKYSVIEQTQIDEILKAQAFSLSGCTDDSCAIEVGELLSAEQIILGSLTKIGTKYLLTAKLIDVESGEHLRADDVQSSSIDDMLDCARALAYSISGMAYQYQPMAGEVLSYGEIYIKTYPNEAEIYINGKKAGVSPYLFSNIPTGKAVIEARKGNYYHTEEVNITGQLLEHSMTLREMTGSMFIDSTVTNMQVYLGGKILGRLQDGLFKDISIGKHILELTNEAEGYYWESEIEVAPDKTLRISAEPVGIGTLSYRFPREYTVEVYNDDISTSLESGRGSVQLQEGRYYIETSGENYIKSVIEVEIGRLTEIYYEPALEYTKEYKQVLQSQEWAGDINQFKRWIENPESYEKTIGEEDKQELETLYAEIEVSQYRDAALLIEIERLYPGYNKAIKENKISLLLDRLDELQAEKSNIETANSVFNVISWSGIGTAIAASTLFTTGMILSEFAYTDYQEAVYSADLVTAREQVQFWDGLNLISGIAAGSTAAIGIATAFVEIDTTDVDAEIAKVSLELAMLNEGIQAE